MKKINRYDWVVVLGFALLIVGPATYLAWLELEEREAREAEEVALFAAEPWRKSPDWRGMTVVSMVSAPHQVWTVFENDPHAPKLRKKMFVKAPSQFREDSLIAWYASIETVVPYGDGWEVVVTICPRFKGTAFTTSKCVETWRIRNSGDAHCVNCEPIIGGFMID